MRAAVLRGGRSCEHDVSLASGASVADGLARGGHDVMDVEVGRDGVWRRDGAEVALRPGRGLLEAEVVFPILHGPYGEDGTVQGLLECLDVPYVGAGVAACALCLDKVAFKERMARAGLPQVAYAGVGAGRFDTEPDAVVDEVWASLGPAVFVKPAHLGSSVGISSAGDRAGLRRALTEAFVHDPSVIVEARAPGVEVECSVIGNAEAEASAPGEIVLDGAAFYDYEAKYTPGGMRLAVPARLPEAVRERVRSLALAAYRRAGCAGLARVDFFVDGEEVLVNELNTMPGFTETSVFAALFGASGVPYTELLDRLVRLALERHAEARRYRS